MTDHGRGRSRLNGFGAELCRERTGGVSLHPPTLTPLFAAATTPYVYPMTRAPFRSSVHARAKWRNRMQTWLLAGGSILLMSLIAFAVLGLVGLVWAAILSAFGLWTALRMSSRMVLGLYRTRKLGLGDVPALSRLVREIAARADLPAVPSLYYVPSRVMNAFAVGKPHDSAIAVTDGILRGLTYRQLAGVLAHEISHIRNGDLAVMALADVVSRLTSIMSVVGLITLALYLPSIVEAGGNVPWLAIGLLVFAPTIGGLLQLALSRAREYDADLDALSLTGDPEGLASALMTLERKQGGLWEGLLLPGARLPDPSILRTHPRTEDRVRRILAMAPSVTDTMTFRDERAAPGRTIVPQIPRPRFHVSRMGLWY